MKNQGILFDLDVAHNSNVVNVASIPQRSPFRYPGGKTWLVPLVRKWLKQEKTLTPLLIEPFAGGGIVGLTAAFEKLADKIITVELDSEVSAVWETILSDDNEWLADKIFGFDLTIENVKKELAAGNKKVRDIAFCTILKNRVYHGGILAKGSGMLKYGENGKGITSRWYPKTLRDRIKSIKLVKDKIKTVNGSAFDIIPKYRDQSNCYFFIDPPYFGAGKRLYTHFDIDHELLFKQVSELKGHYLLTYDNLPEIRVLAKKYELKYCTTPMKTTHHLEKEELLISDNFSWMPLNS